MVLFKSTPNAGDDLRRLALRQAWDTYANYLESLDKIKPVIATGDYNVAHTEIDLANPESNHFSAGFTEEERNGFQQLLNKGFTDTFRHLNGNVTDNTGQRVKTSNNSGYYYNVIYFK